MRSLTRTSNLLETDKRQKGEANGIPYTPGPSNRAFTPLFSFSPRVDIDWTSNDDEYPYRLLQQFALGPPPHNKTKKRYTHSIRRSCQLSTSVGKQHERSTTYLTSETDRRRRRAVQIKREKTRYFRGGQWCAKSFRGKSKHRSSSIEGKWVDVGA